MKSLLALLAFSTLSLAASAKVSENFNQTYPLSAKGSIHLSNVNGSVEIVAWDKNEVALEAVKTAKDQEALGHIKITVEASAKKIVVKTEHEKTWKFWENAQAEVRYHLMVPAGVSLDKIAVVNAGIRITGVKGSIDADSVNGSIEAEGLAGEGDFHTINGSINVAYAAMPHDDGEISLATVNGSCALKLPADAGFKLDADTINGGVTCDFPLTLEKSNKHTLRGTTGNGHTGIELDSVNGGLTVTKTK